MNWPGRAACRGIDIDLFYPGKGPGGRKQTREAKEVCLSCSVRVECLEFAMAMELTDDAPTRRYGIFGGKTAEERIQLWRRRGR